MLSPSRFIPVVLIVVVLSFSVRLTDVVTGLSQMSATAVAASDEKDDAEQGDDIAATETDEIPAVEAEPTDPQPKWRDASDSDLDVSDVRMEIFKDLSDRRDIIREREREMQVREALLKAAEQEMDRKMQELKTLRTEIESLLNTQSEEEKKRIDSLVKIYEGMKPKEAARIFDTLDIDVLLAVLSNMPEKKVGPVMAAMKPERARTITLMMAEQKTLPSLD